MSAPGSFDVWLLAFERMGSERAAQALSLAFGLEHAVALRLLSDLPCRVKSGTTIVDAQGIADALIAIGGQAEVMRSDEPLPVAAPAAPLPPAPESPPLGNELYWERTPSFEPIVATATIAQDQWQAALALPAWDRPPASVRPMRDPSLRQRPPRAGPASLRPGSSARPASQRLLEPLKLTAGVLRQAEQSSWQRALSGHPVFGFLLVLALTTAVCLLLYGLARSVRPEPDAPSAVSARHGSHACARRGDGLAPGAQAATCTALAPHHRHDRRPAEMRARNQVLDDGEALIGECANDGT